MSESDQQSPLPVGGDGKLTAELQAAIDAEVVRLLGPPITELSEEQAEKKIPTMIQPGPWLNDGEGGRAAF